MSNSDHKITFSIEHIGAEPVLVFKAIGTLTHEDYEAMTPLLESRLHSLEGQPIKMLVDITEFEGWELRAAWDDFKFGLKVGLKIDKIAIYGDKNWQELAAKVGGWFISGEMKSFGDYQSAADWIVD